jgi:pyruvate/2-oxoacid:ferredoxin oxidoreductase beta subunit
VDELLCELIAEMGIDRDTFYSACEQSNRNPTHRRVVQQILSVDDFVAFKRMMVKKNLQLSEIAL